jgi:arylsulfatase A-like enzyme
MEANGLAEDDGKTHELSRREFLESTGLAAVGLSAGSLGSVVSLAAAETKAAAGGGEKPWNILFILTDQERYFDPETLPAGYSLPGRERLQREGTSFVNNQISTCVCSSSRSVIYTGQHIQHTKVFDNLGFPWSNELSLDTPTIGAYLQQAGYYPAYQGKCHMLDELEEIEIGDVPDVNMDELNKAMQEHGFNDYIGVGDIIGNTMGGYKSDEFTTSTAIRWLRSEPPRLADKPWFLAVNLVNPHDVMFYNTDAPGAAPIQEDEAAMPVNRGPAHALYQESWDMPLPESRHETWDLPSRPPAHYNFQTARGALVGQFPSEDARWRRLQDYYLNCIADCDRHVDRLLRELDDLGLAENTIVIMTSDHGELGGAHQMHGKGATAYREQLNVPLWVRHPGEPNSAGVECQALTSHVDLVPTILGLAGVDAERRKTIAPNLHGQDFSGIMKSPGTASVDAVRSSALYNFNMWLFQDPDFLAQMIGAMKSGQNPAELGLKLDLARRGAIRSVTDGRYRFSRYFSPEQHNSPRSFEALFQYNDVELYDLENDPNEMRNLAVDRRANGELLLAMNQKLNEVIEAEVGSDNGEFLPENKAGWALTHFDP